MFGSLRNAFILSLTALSVVGACGGRAEREERSCWFEGVAYPHGTSGLGCEDCSCNDGQLVCAHDVCPEAIRGTGSGSSPSPDPSTGPDASMGPDASNEHELGCVFFGVWFPSRSFVPDPGGCNSCDCQNGSVACTAVACSSDPCYVDFQRYPSGSVGVPDPASCNTCACVNGELTACGPLSCAYGKPCRFGRQLFSDGLWIRTDTGECKCSEGQFRCARR